MTQKLSSEALANKKAYTLEYKKTKYKRVPLDLTTDKYNEIKTRSQELGESVNGFIKQAIDDRLNNTKPTL